MCDVIQIRIFTSSNPTCVSHMSESGRSQNRRRPAGQQWFQDDHLNPNYLFIFIFFLVLNDLPFRGRVRSNVFNDGHLLLCSCWIFQ